MDSVTSHHYIRVRLFNVWFLLPAFLLSEIPQHNSVPQSQNKDTVASKKVPGIEAMLWPIERNATGSCQDLCWNRICNHKLPIELVATKDTLPNTTFETPFYVKYLCIHPTAVPHSVLYSLYSMNNHIKDVLVGKFHPSWTESIFTS